MRPRLELESTRGRAASTEPFDRAALAPMVAKCLSSVLRETLAGTGPLFGLEGTCGSDLPSLRSVIKISIRSWAKGIAEWELRKRDLTLIKSGHTHTKCK